MRFFLFFLKAHSPTSVHRHSRNFPTMRGFGPNNADVISVSLNVLLIIIAGLNLFD